MYPLHLKPPTCLALAKKLRHSSSLFLNPPSLQNDSRLSIFPFSSCGSHVLAGTGPSLKLFQRAWLQMIERDLAPFPIINRRSIYAAAWFGAFNSATVQIRSDKQIYVTSGPRSRFNPKETHPSYIYPSLVMLELMLRDMQDVPNVTLVYKYSDNCVFDYTATQVLGKLDIEAMKKPSHWDGWLLDSKEQWDWGSDAVPSTGVGPLVFYMRGNDGEPSDTCYGVSMPNYDWLIVPEDVSFNVL